MAGEDSTLINAGRAAEWGREGEGGVTSQGQRKI